ncbi:hypothetical protein PybrP1_000951 [[Pythium] brassicae (nom. inval.)]|nr:hypothetical protein PybrP1_000951 [[Pythium] brassicae (nom. inval.)]
MVLGQLRVAVIGAETHNDGVNKPYTVFRTVVNFRGQCYQRLIRYRQFNWFHKRLHLRNKADAKAIVFPSREWTRNASLQEDVVEARQVLLNEYMDKVTTCELTPGCYDRLLRLLKVGDYDVEPPQGHPAPQKTSMAAMKSSYNSVDFHRDPGHEDAIASAIEQQQRRNRASGKSNRSANGATDQISAGMATIVNSSVVYRSMTSTADTTLTDEEQPPSTDGESSDEQDSLRSRSSLVAPSAYAQHFVEDRPKLRSSMSVPVRRVKKVKFSDDSKRSRGSSLLSPEDHRDSDVTDDASPEKKLRRKGESQSSRAEGMQARCSLHDDRSHLPLELLISTPSAVLARNRAETL